MVCPEGILREMSGTAPNVGRPDFDESGGCVERIRVKPDFGQSFLKLRPAKLATDELPVRSGTRRGDW